ncbi:hypothetical protein BVRB_6g138310 [Beta vulgaris subsp. vulgaris]|nr:hypothetical protein BVRB_6g138310 [Beta vulgaris subsp. vulgaris]
MKASSILIRSCGDSNEHFTPISMTDLMYFILHSFPAKISA